MAGLSGGTEKKTPQWKDGHKSKTFPVQLRNIRNKTKRNAHRVNSPRNLGKVDPVEGQFLKSPILLFISITIELIKKLSQPGHQIILLKNENQKDELKLWNKNRLEMTVTCFPLFFWLFFPIFREKISPWPVRCWGLSLARGSPEKRGHQRGPWLDVYRRLTDGSGSTVGSLIPSTE